MLDDSYVDDVLGDGIHGQDLVDNDCYKEIQSHMDLKVAAQNAALETVSTEEAVRALIRDNVTLSDKTKKRLQDYQVEESFSTTNWMFGVAETWIVSRGFSDGPESQDYGLAETSDGNWLGYFVRIVIRMAGDVEASFAGCR